MKYKNKFTQHIFSSKRFLLSEFYSGDSKSRARLSKIVDRLIEHLLKVWKTRGERDFVDQSKDLRRQIHCVLSEKKVCSSQTVLYLDGFTGPYKFLNRCIRVDDFEAIRILLSISTYSRSFRTKPSPSFSTIKGASKERESSLYSSERLAEFWSIMGFKATNSKPEKVSSVT